MSTISDLKEAIRSGNTELVRDIVSELDNNYIDISSALELANNINRTKAKRGKWDDIVNILQEYFN